MNVRIETSFGYENIIQQIHLLMLAEILQAYCDDHLGDAKQAGYSVKIGQVYNGIEISI